MFFSVVVPIYNVEKYLCECVDSVLAQTFKDFELILVDDGSTDASSAICDEYAEKDSRIKVIHKKNGGQSSARNEGVKSALGEYAIFIDSDDIMNDDTYLKTVHEVAKDGIDIIAFRYCKYYGDRTDDCGISLAGIKGDKAETLLELVKRDAFFCSCWSKSVRLELIKSNNIVFDELLSCEDMDWYYSVVRSAKTIKVIDKPFVYYRQRQGSVTSGYKEKTIKDYIFTIDKWNQIFSNKENGTEKTALLSSLAKLYCNLLISYSRHMKEAAKFRKEIFSFKDLLKNDLNPRTKKIGKCSRLVGLGLTCQMFRLIEKVR